MNIVICDDISEQLAELENAVNNCARLQKQQVKLTKFNGGRECLEAIRAGLHVDLLITDVRMPDVGGVDVISALPPDCDASVVFATAFGESWPQTRIHNESGYLVKPYTQKTFDETIDIVLGRKESVHIFEYKYVDIDKFDGSFVYKRDKISCNRITYFIAINHNVDMYTLDAVKRISGTKLKNIADELEPYGFFLCNRSTLINLRYYHDRTNSDAIVKAGGTTSSVHLSRDRVAALEKAVMAYKVEGKYAF